MGTPDKNVALNIIAKREALGLEQKELARLADIDYVYLNKIENFHRNAGPNVLASLALFFGCTPEDLKQKHVEVTQKDVAESMLSKMTQLQMAETVYLYQEDVLRLTARLAIPNPELEKEVRALNKVIEAFRHLVQKLENMAGPGPPPKK